MAEDKNFYKELRRQLLGGYGKTDCEIDQTTSWPDGLDEASRFSPYLRRPVRRTDSVDDIERYYRYFSLAQRNQGNQFTWKCYCNILLADLVNSNVLAALNKLSIQPSCAPVKSKGSNVPPIQKSASSMKKIFEKRAPIKRSFLDVDSDNALPSEDVRFLASSKSVAKFSNQPSATPIQSDASKPRTVGRVSSMRRLFEKHASKKRSFLDIEADVESVSSSDDVKFHTPSKNVLKKMCTEIRTLAQKTCKTVEKISTPNKYCSSCGNVIRSTTVHKKCSKQHEEKSDCNKHLTPSMIGSTNYCKNRPMTFESPSITPVYIVDPRTKRFRFKPSFKP